MYTVNFQENGGEYAGKLVVHCNKINVHANDKRIFYADHVRIEVDEQVISIEDRKGNYVWKNSAL